MMVAGFADDFDAYRQAGVIGAQATLVASIREPMRGQLVVLSFEAGEPGRLIGTDGSSHVVNDQGRIEYVAQRSVSWRWIDGYGCVQAELRVNVTLPPPVVHITPCEKIPRLTLQRLQIAAANVRRVTAKIAGQTHAADALAQSESVAMDLAVDTDHIGRMTAMIEVMGLDGVTQSHSWSCDVVARDVNFHTQLTEFGLYVAVTGAERMTLHVLGTGEYFDMPQAAWLESTALLPIHARIDAIDDSGVVHQKNVTLDCMNVWSELPAWQALN